MRLPTVNYKNKARTFIQEFLGYNHNLRTSLGEFYDMKNVSMDHYPVISTRQGEEEKYTFEGNPNGLHEYAENTLMAVCGNTLHVGITADSEGEIVEGSDLLLTDSEKSFATLGTETLIMPDKIIYNSKTGRLEQIEESIENVDFDNFRLNLYRKPCDIEGNIKPYQSGDEPPEDTDYWWYDTEKKEWKQYSSVTESWVIIAPTYFALVLGIEPGLDIGISEEDEEEVGRIGRYFDRFETLDTIWYTYIKETSYVEEQFTVFGKGRSSIFFNEDQIVPITYVVVQMDRAPSLDGNFKIDNKCPELSHLVALNNRIWGVRTEDDKGNPVNDIYACKLGDPSQWFKYSGTAADSYAVSLGFADEITASIAYNNYVHFFTESKILKIYGDYPANYQIHTTKTEGVVSGGHDSIVQAGSILFWVSPIGVMAYDGSIPYFRGQKFSPNYLNGKTVVAGKDGQKYCLSVSENGESCGVFVFDQHTGLWTVGGDQIFVKTATMNNALCVMNDASKIITYYDRELTKDKGITEEDIPWSLETGNIGFDTPAQKYISRIQMRIDYKGSLKVEVSYDNDEEYTTVHESESDHMRSITVPIRVKRSDHMRIRLSGVGQMNLYSLSYEVEEGGNRCLI